MPTIPDDPVSAFSIIYLVLVFHKLKTASPCTFTGCFEDLRCEYEFKREMCGQYILAWNLLVIRKPWKHWSLSATALVALQKNHVIVEAGLIFLDTFFGKYMRMVFPITIMTFQPTNKTSSLEIKLKRPGINCYASVLSKYVWSEPFLHPPPPNIAFVLSIPSPVVFLFFFFFQHIEKSRQARRAEMGSSGEN